MIEVEREQIEDACYRAGLEPESAIYEDYSGRGMYGEVCFGLVHDNMGDLLMFVAGLATAEGVPWDVEWVGRARQDNMGLATITYWPGVQLAKADASA